MRTERFVNQSALCLPAVCRRVWRIVPQKKQTGRGKEKRAGRQLFRSGVNPETGGFASSLFSQNRLPGRGA